MLDRLGLVMLLFGLAGMISAGLAGWAVARNGLRPVRRLTTAVEDIARTERLDPIPVEGNDEVARLAQAFNAMLTSLSASQARQRQLVADAGHELRTPLTSLRTNLDLLAQADASTQLSEESRKELLDDVRAQITEMTTLIGDLVELAREEPTDAVGRAGRARRRRQPGGHPGPAPCDHRRVRRAHRAVVGHRRPRRPRARDHQPARQRGEVEPRGRPRDRRAQAGHGDGRRPGPAASPRQDLPHVFDRFYRSTESRGMPGSGLGLSIVKAVADRHGGDVRAGTGTRRRRGVLVPRARHDGAARGLGTVVAVQRSLSG